MSTHSRRLLAWAAIVSCLLASPSGSRSEGEPPAAGHEYPEEPDFESPAELVNYGKDQKKALRIHEAIYQAIGFGNSFMIVTKAGNVIVDTSSPTHAPRHKKLLQAENAGPIKYIVLTHGHGDHTGGIPLWKEADTQIVAQENHVELVHYQKRLEGFFARRNAAQFARPVPKVGDWPGNFGAKIEPTILFDDGYAFELGGIRFEAFHTPGETEDHLTLWIPEYKAAFVGDNYYRSFPNLYSLRGTQQRKALEYVKSLDKVIALRPEILLPSHGTPIHGNAEITRTLTRYRDAIQYVHDEVVKGMNAGKDVFTLMREVRLPQDLDRNQSYGRLTWSVRGIYEGYAGWFDLNPATMYDQPASTVYPEIVTLAGGPDVLARLALKRIEEGQPAEALHLTNVSLAADPRHRKTLEARLKVLETLRAQGHNIIERGWLDDAIGRTQETLGRQQPDSP